MKIDTKENNCFLSLEGYYIPTLEGKRFLVIDEPIEVLNEVSKFSELDTLETKVLAYGAGLDDSLLKEIEHDVKSFFGGTYFEYDLATHIGKLGILNKIPIMVLISFWFPPFALLYLPGIKKDLKIDKIASKFKESSIELFANLEVIRENDVELEGKLSELESYYNFLNGSTQDIYLKMASKSEELGLEKAQEFYLRLFDENKSTARILERLKKVVKEGRKKNKKLKKVTVKERDLKKPLFKNERGHKANLDFIAIPTIDNSLEIYFVDGLSIENNNITIQNVVTNIDILAHLKEEKNVKINSRIFIPDIIDNKNLKESLSYFIHQNEYFEQKIKPETNALMLNQNPMIKIMDYLFIGYGMMNLASHDYIGAAFFIGMGLSDLTLGKIVRKKQGEHFLEVAKGYDKLYSFNDLEQIIDPRLKKLERIIKYSEDELSAYTNAYHLATELGLKDIARIYQEKAMFYQRGFKEPSSSILKLKNVQ